MIIPAYHAYIYDAGTVDDAQPHLIHEGEYDIRCELEWQYGEPVVHVIDVLEDGRSLYSSADCWVKQLACRVADVAENDDFVIEQVVQDYTDNREAA